MEIGNKREAKIGKMKWKEKDNSNNNTVEWKGGRMGNEVKISIMIIKANLNDLKMNH